MTEIQTAGSHLLDTVTEWLGTYIRTANTGDLHTLTLWAVHTHLVTETYTTPRLLLDSPAPGAGKTTTLDHLQRLCHHPVQAASLPSPSLLARLLQNGPRTILVDEADRTLNPKNDGVGDLLAVLNSGYRRGASRPVLVQVEGKNWEPVEMSTFGPVAMAGNSPNLPDDTRSRCIRVLLLPDYEGTVSDSDWQYIEDDAALLREQVEAWADEVRDEVRTNRPTYPDGLTGRNRERWAPLYKVALAAGGAWPDHCRNLIAADLADMQADREDGLTRVPRHVQLLRDIAAVWPDGETFFPTGELLDSVQRRQPGMWGAASPYGALTPQGMGRVLVTHFGIRASRLTGNRSRGGRGYYLQVFVSAMSSFGIPVPGRQGVPGEPVRVVHRVEPVGNLTGLTASTGLTGSPRTPTEPDKEPGDGTAAVVLAALSPTFGQTLGHLMKVIKDKTGDGSRVPDILDRLTADGRVTEEDGNYTLREDL